MLQTLPPTAIRHTDPGAIAESPAAGPNEPTMTDASSAAVTMTADQSEVFTLLGDRRTHAVLFPVTRIDTHSAVVFLAGLDVYKVKRAVRFSFMDLSTLAKRKAACEAEVAVNRRYAPEIYHGAVPITRAPGGIAIAGPGEPVEWAVHMRRFDETRTLDHVAERGELGTVLVTRLADALVEVYRDAEIRDGAAATRALRGVVEETLASLADARTFFPPLETERLAAAMMSAFDRLTPLLLDRGAKGRVRRCHGDLHLRNITLLNGVPTPFDAIEFDESIASIDVLYDLAFLLMDLWERDLPAQANLVLNRYLWKTTDPELELEGLAALPLLMSLRAAVRAKVEALRLVELGEGADQAGEARRYFAVAAALLAEARPSLIAIGGISGSGKSSVAAHIAARVGRAPGAVHLRSDIERKRLCGVDERSRLPPGAYGQATTERVYAALRDQAARALGAGQCVVVDAVHHRPDERTAIADVAAGLGIPFAGIWLETSYDVAADRVSARRSDASDATPAVVARQAAEPTGHISWTRVDASGHFEDVAGTVQSAVARLLAGFA